MTNYNAQNYGKMVEGQMEQAAEITLKEIIIDWVEARREGDLESETFTTVQSAEIALAARAYDAPRTGGYDKIDLKIVLSNSDTYEGRIDLQYQHRTGYSIRNHVVNFLSYIAGNIDLMAQFHVTREEMQQSIDLYNRVLA